jgi:hypothetical protein
VVGGEILLSLLGVPLTKPKQAISAKTIPNTERRREISTSVELEDNCGL